MRPLTVLAAPKCARPQVCSELNDDHGQAHLRRHPFTQPPLWYITVADRTETWVILWEQSPGDPADAIIRYIGPASGAVMVVASACCPIGKESMPGG